MEKFKSAEIALYRWRYLIGYTLIALALFSVLLLSGIYLPGGLSNQEMQSVVQSNSLSFSKLFTTNLINLPFYLLQHLSIKLLGVSILSIKLPSIILAFLSAIGLVTLLRHWFKPSISILASLIAIATSQFLFIAQNGTPDILFLFWPICLILLASLIATTAKHQTIYLIALSIVIALSLYTPFSLYIIIAMVIAILFHPHLRFFVKQIPNLKLVICSIVIVLLIIPLIINLARTPSLWLTMLGLPAVSPNLNANLGTLFNQYFNFINPISTTQMAPFFELGSMLLIAIGLFHVIRIRVTSRNYVILIWLVCLLPVILLNPSVTGIAYLPMILLLAVGLDALLMYWYRLFPYNPYARVGGLIPIIVLVSVLIFSGIDRYTLGYRYNPQIVPNFSKDLNLIPASTTNIVVSNDELDFYKVLASHNSKLKISTTPSSSTFLVTRQARQNMKFDGYKIDKIITSNLSKDSDRFYLYKNQ
jgi:hypothetical protein